MGRRMQRCVPYMVWLPSRMSDPSVKDSRSVSLRSVVRSGTPRGSRGQDSRSPAKGSCHLLRLSRILRVGRHLARSAATREENLVHIGNLGLSIRC